jgi:hypothetical protein
MTCFFDRLSFVPYLLYVGRWKPIARPDSQDYRIFSGMVVWPSLVTVECNIAVSLT